MKYNPYKIAFKETKFPDESWSYIAPTWEDMHKLYLNLGVEILKDSKQFDALVTLAKGGWTWGRTIADILNIREVASFKLTLYDYKSPGKIMKEPSLESPLIADLNHKRVLLFDDVNDSGQSMIWSLKYLKFFNPSSVVTATLFHKPHAKYTPDYYGFETKSWIIFPHESRETIEGLSKKWLEKGMKKEEIKDRLLKIGLMKEEIELFFE